MTAHRGEAPDGGSPALVCHRLTVSYGEDPVLEDLGLEVARGEAVAVLGPSGSGKTTLLHAVAGFVDPDAGEIRIAGERVSDARTSRPPNHREVGLVFQHYALWPHMSALENVAYPLRRRRAEDADGRARELLDRMGLAEFAGRRPSQLSGGQQQRVGLARALARDASIYLFDEPTAHLDTALRGALQEEMTERRRERGAAAVYATHDATEALAVADRIALLRAGRVVQVGSPADVYRHPADLWAARLTGPASVLRLRPSGGRAGRLRVRIGEHEVEVDADGAPDGRERVDVIVRPDWTRLGGDLRGTVRRSWYRGPHTDYDLETDAGRLIVREPGPPREGAGQRVSWTLARGWALTQRGAARDPSVH